VAPHGNNGVKMGRKTTHPGMAETAAGPDIRFAAVWPRKEPEAMA